MFELTEKQKEIVNSPARVKLVMGGNRSGKTATAIMNLWENLKAHSRRVLYLVNNDKMLRFVRREIEDILPVIGHQILKVDNTERFTTEFGEIYISTDFINEIDFETITIDDSTSNKYANENLLSEYDGHIYMTGHIPENNENNFFKLWLKYYFLNELNCNAFRISTWDNPRMVKLKSKEDELKLEMGLQRYLRQYESIPDYTESDISLDIKRDVKNKLNDFEYKFKSSD